MSAEARLAELGLQLPPAPKPKGLYRPVVIVDNLVYTSGHLPVRADGSLVTGCVGAELDQNAACEASRLAGLALLASLRAELGTLDRVRRVVKLVGYVRSTAEFHQQPAVLNGCSELLAQLFGPDHGIGARTALGTPSLPLGAAVEIEAIFQID